MKKDIAACKNYNCEAYKNNKCARCMRHRYALSIRETFVAYIPPRSGDERCELFVEYEE